MKYSELLSLADYLKQYDFIYKAKRIDDNTIVLRFDKKYEFGFVMTRGNSTVYRTEQMPFLQNYNAPFDNILESFATSSKILDVALLANDRVLRFELESKNSYRSKKVFLQFEFTGKFTNAIILDENEIIIEALRHIDASKSFRVIRPNIELAPLLPREQKTDNATIDIEALLNKNYEETERSKIENVKNRLLQNFEKKRSNLQKILNSLPDNNELKKDLEQNNIYGNLILANMHLIKPYDKKLETLDFEGNKISILLPEKITKNRLGDYFFDKAKKAKNKIKHIHIQKENLNKKLDFINTTINLIQNAKNYEQMSFFIPPKSSQKRTKNIDENLNIVWIEGYKVYIGRNKNENKILLEISKSNDIWMHIRDEASSHVIIKTDKQSVPQSVIKKAANLCVEFSGKNAGDYVVDYTKRKFVKPQEDANVFYTNYDSVFARKEGIEIRS